MQIAHIRDYLIKEIEAQTYGEEPDNLYEPIRYLMTLGGKRMRPLLTVLAYTLFKDDWKNSIKPALGVEVFHNFTLMHDDIMDEAPLRRGKATVHEKWNPNIAILSGDVMLVKAYDFLLHSPPEVLMTVLKAFNRCAREVCEGQQLDMNFESRAEVEEQEYLEMIRLKTAVLLGFALELGGILAGADEASIRQLKHLGEAMGIAFQLKDDYLDVYGDAAKFGKQVGGDIIANKKTFLLIKALENADSSLERELKSWLERTDFDKAEKVSAVKNIYQALKIDQLCLAKMQEYFIQAETILNQMQINTSGQNLLADFIQEIMQREK